MGVCGKRDMVRNQARLVVVSNRVPSLAIPESEEAWRVQGVGGLVSALRPALEEREGIWFGWSGRSTERQPSTAPVTSSIGFSQLAVLDLSKRDARLFYGVFANQTLWPLLHNFLGRVVIHRDAYRAFRHVNQRFAESLYPMLRSGDLVWVHDYHLFLVGSELRRLGWSGKIGFFLHVPFPPVDVFAILPWARQLLEGLCSYDLVGVHTTQYGANLIECLRAELGGTMTDGVFTFQNMTLRVAVHPIGIDASGFQRWAREAAPNQPDRLLERVAPGRRVILGVDRLDYTKGIPERLLAFEYLLAHYPSLRGKVVFFQISAPSRSRVPEYIREKERVDQLVGRINGRFSESDWAPVHSLFRSYTQQELAAFYRRADVCLVTPLRDGMNLVAKEFVASQGAPPGVLVLSKFCGSAETMPEALIVNPYDIEMTAEAIKRALEMSMRERRRRWDALLRHVQAQTTQSWCDAFLADLAGHLSSGHPGLTQPVKGNTESPE